MNEKRKQIRILDSWRRKMLTAKASAHQRNSPRSISYRKEASCNLLRSLDLGSREFATLGLASLGSRFAADSALSLVPLLIFGEKLKDVTYARSSNAELANSNQDFSYSLDLYTTTASQLRVFSHSRYLLLIWNELEPGTLPTP